MGKMEEGEERGRGERERERQDNTQKTSNMNTYKIRPTIYIHTCTVRIKPPGTLHKICMLFF